MGDAPLKMLKNYFCLCSCVHGLGPAYAAYILAYTGLFLRFYICGDGPAYAGSCLRKWALTRLCKTSSKSSTRPVFISFSLVSFLYAIVTHLFVIFAFEYYCNKTSYFPNSACIRNLMSSFFFFGSHHPLMLVGEALIKWWSGTIFMSPKSRAISERQASSLSLVFFQRSL